MRKILFINAYSNWGSTGRIVEQIGLLAQKKGWKCYVAYGRKCNPSSLKVFKIGNLLNVYEHYAEHRLFDREGLASKFSTRYLIKKIGEIKPDIIHLHNIHDHWLNYEILFSYLSSANIPVVWTQHDCWSFTGGCPHFTVNNCYKWKVACNYCNIRKKNLPFVDGTKRNFENKKKWFCSLKKLTLVPVSQWLENIIRQSFLCSNNIVTIYNGVDTSIFKPIPANNIKQQLHITKKNMLVAAATTWSDRKGLKDYIKLAYILSDDTQIVLVGLSGAQIKSLPSNIKGIPRTHNAIELASLYSAADIVLNLSYEETFGLTTVEGFACGTPSIVYNTTASPELITPETGLVVEPGNIEGIAEAINIILSKGKTFFKNACRQRAVTFYNIDDRYKDYINLYDSLLYDDCKHN